MKKLNYKSIAIFFLKSIGFLIFSILIISFLVGEYLVITDRTLGYYGDNSIRISKLFIPFQDEKRILLYESKSAIDFSGSRGYIQYRDSFVEGKNDKNYPKLPREIGLNASYTLFSTNDVTVAKDFFLKETNSFNKLFGNSISTNKSKNSEKLLWKDLDTILILTFTERDCGFISNCDEGKFAVYADLQDRRLEKVDEDWFGESTPYLLFFRNILDLPISRFGIFKKVWYMDN